MKQFKLYFDKDLEQNWLMEKSKQGWAFKKFFLGLYTFEPCQPGEYQYQIDLLDSWSADKKDYKAFMEDTGIDVIAQWYRWIYLRKKTADGPFELYTDNESKKRQYQRICKFFTVGLVIELIGFLLELAGAIMTGRTWVFGMTFLIGCIVLLFFQMVCKCKRKIAELENCTSHG